MELAPEAKALLYEYYIYKIKHKELEKQTKTVKALADYLRKTVKITAEDTLEQLNPVIDQKPEFANTKQDIRHKAIEEAVKLATKGRARSESSESYESQHSTPRNRK